MAFEINKLEQDSLRQKINNRHLKPKKERKQSFSFTLTPSLKARLDDKSEETGFGSSSRLLEKILSEHIDEY
ncbi:MULTISPECIES: hypothetical protein [Holzapfeliella]|uniref:Uncharacterized protein n=1 Tax=Holzapfeliella floricola DSM 23037 = JCM 16512 TaxID=1423744 RepID=A0A0R2DJ00_9LACO|nr:hypothetical protein [Holzapfeliella floricola]KRN04065.1 hypothetical protein FC86_GL000596 [Holzapfeliella floricola DSM 23037 = JCM 16512]